MAMSFIVTLKSDVRDLWFHSKVAPVSKRMWPWTLDRSKATAFKTRAEAEGVAAVMRHEIPYPNKIEVVQT